MSEVVSRNYWLYDEVVVSWEASDVSRIIFDSPWLNHSFSIDPILSERAHNIINKMKASTVGAEDLAEVTWFLSAVKSYPFVYILPRIQIFSTDVHSRVGNDILNFKPEELLKSLLNSSHHSSKADAILKELSLLEWTWDIDAVISFSKMSNGYDPVSVFSVLRRFHLLNDIENNKTRELLSYLSTLDKNSEAFKFGNALVIRQNHYITQACEPVLSASLELSQSARSKVLEFIQAESGHDKILEVALKSMGQKAEEVPVLDCIYVLMDLFEVIARKNFLAFSAVVDVFERSSYLSEDPFSTVLKKGGEERAAYQLNIHRDIN
ncbi:MAG: hypothetical protein ABL927_14705, partial [Bdellovibrionales bacterium]